MGTYTLPTGSAPPSPALDSLFATTDKPDFDPVAPTNIPEAVQFRRLYTVGNYVLARIPDALATLNTRLTSTTDGTAPVLTNKAKLVQDHGVEIDAILRMINEESNSQAAIEREVRSWFDLGVATAPNVNVRFKQVLRDFATICSDDLFGVDPATLDLKSVVDPTASERLVRLYRDAKRRLIDLIGLMSASGTLGSDRLISKWAEVIDRSLKVLQPVGGFVASDDADDKFVWSVTAALVGRDKDAILPYVVHAREGGKLLEDSIAVYLTIQGEPGRLADEDPDYLKKLFGEKDKVFAGTGMSAATRLRRNAALALASWPWG